jgi:hypothetical protein
MYRLKHKITGRVISIESIKGLMLDNWVIIDSNYQEQKVIPMNNRTPYIKEYRLRHKKEGIYRTLTSVNGVDFEQWEIVSVTHPEKGKQLGLFSRRDLIEKLRVRVREEKMRNIIL